MWRTEVWGFFFGMIVSKVVLLFPFFFLVKEKKNTKKVRRLIPRDTLTVFLGLRCIVVASFYVSVILRTDRQSVKTIVFFWGGAIYILSALFSINVVIHPSILSIYHWKSNNIYTYPRSQTAQTILFSEKYKKNKNKKNKKCYLASISYS